MATGCALVSEKIAERDHPMQFTRALHEGIRCGEITSTIRIWTKPHVKVGGRYRLGNGEIQVESIQQMTLADITPELARRSGFKGVIDLLKTAKHGKGENVYFIVFRYREPSVETSSNSKENDADDKARHLNSAQFSKGLHR